MCGIYYLGALRAAEELARAVGDTTSAQTYRKLFEQGSQWIDANLFSGEHYIQKVRGFRPDEIAGNLRSDMGSENTETPEYQLGSGCLVDQLVGQYLADVSGLGALVSPDKIRTTLGSIYRYNYKRSLVTHDNVQRTFALNDEASLVICDYGKAERPHIPFPYFAETMTGFEYTAAVLMMNWGMVAEGLECVGNIRARYDGEKRNPWDEAECGHHYARAMAAWSAILALSGFSYDGASSSVVAAPLISQLHFQSFWSSGTGWGNFALHQQHGVTVFTMKVLEGSLNCRSCEIVAPGTAALALRDGKVVENRVDRRKDRLVVTFNDLLRLTANDEIRIEVHA
jgi:hypothetical protein